MGEIYGKYATAFTLVRNPPLDCENPHFRNRYASLKACVAAVRAACAEAGIVYRQSVDVMDDGRVVLRSSVMDYDGGTMELSVFPIEQIANAQAFGSEMTYKKRQQIQADWLIVGDTDDDGEAAVGHRAERPSRFSRLSKLKEQAIAMGAAEEYLKDAVNLALNGKSLKDATDIELRECEERIEAIIGNMGGN